HMVILMQYLRLSNLIVPYVRVLSGIMESGWMSLVSMNYQRQQMNFMYCYHDSVTKIRMAMEKKMRYHFLMLKWTVLDHGLWRPLVLDQGIIEDDGEVKYGAIT